MAWARSTKISQKYKIARVRQSYITLEIAYIIRAQHGFQPSLPPCANSLREREKPGLITRPKHIRKTAGARPRFISLSRSRAKAGNKGIAGWRHHRAQCARGSREFISTKSRKCHGANRELRSIAGIARALGNFL